MVSHVIPNGGWLYWKCVNSNKLSGVLIQLHLLVGMWEINFNTGTMGAAQFANCTGYIIPSFWRNSKSSSTPLRAKGMDLALWNFGCVCGLILLFKLQSRHPIFSQQGWSLALGYQQPWSPRLAYGKLMIWCLLSQLLVHIIWIAAGSQ